MEENKTANYVHENRITLFLMCVSNFHDGSAATKICNKVTTDDRWLMTKVNVYSAMSNFFNRHFISIQSCIAVRFAIIRCIYIYIYIHVHIHIYVYIVRSMMNDLFGSWQTHKNMSRKHHKRYNEIEKTWTTWCPSREIIIIYVNSCTSAYINHIWIDVSSITRNIFLCKYRIIRLLFLKRRELLTSMYRQY